MMGGAAQLLDRQLSSLEAGTSAAAFTLENVLAEVEDLLSYCNDILCTGAGTCCLLRGRLCM
jgi:hypothetical protein